LPNDDHEISEMRLRITELLHTFTPEALRELIAEIEALLINHPEETDP
jgi:hypothetical protein